MTVSEGLRRNIHYRRARKRWRLKHPDVSRAVLEAQP